ncbi:Na+/H+ antiporter NhaC [Iocasia frigidifontis]|uniref:Na+/H+ antiporter NhaC n=1 Tax=Iocasia fonsfrigidae TaxID=2682810 RepID=UPI001E5061B0|nr:Na+/H+ antiporter NhaC [Iocasia fonsfrigidae]
MTEEKINQTDAKLPSFGGVLFVLLFLAVGMAISVLWLSIPVHVTLILTIVVAALVAMQYGYTWQEIQDAMLYGANLAMLPMLILMIIGVVIGTWVASGTIQTIIYYGLLILSPSYFLVAASIVVALASMSTGSSYTSGGTVGVAMMGIGAGLGVPAAMTAGAVISGAILGDKMSPLSDSTNLASAVGEADLFDHIKSMMYTTIPAFVIALIAYWLLGLFYVQGTADASQVELITSTLRESFVINPIMLIPPILVIVMAVKKVASLPTMIAASLVAALLALIFQGSTITEITNVMNYGYTGSTGVAEVDQILTRGGLQSMMWTVSLGFVGVGLGGILEKTKMLEVFLSKFSSLVANTGGLIATTVVSAIGLNLATASQYMAIIITGRMVIPEFKKKKLLPRVLSRTLEDAGTVFSPLVPWGLCGVFFTGALGVPTTQYFPFVFLALFVPIIAVIYGFSGYAIWYEGDFDDPTAYSAQENIKS